MVNGCFIIAAFLLFLLFFVRGVVVGVVGSSSSSSSTSRSISGSSGSSSFGFLLYDIFSYTVLKKSTFYDFSEASFLDFKIFTAFCSYRPRSS